MTSLAARYWKLFLSAPKPVVTITAPTEDAQVMTTSTEFDITWTVEDSAGATLTQTHYKVQIFSDEDATILIYDSDWVASAVKSHTTAASGALPSGAYYWIRVYVRTDTRGGARSPLRRILYRIAIFNAQALTVQAVGGDCGSLADPFALPGIRLTFAPDGDVIGTGDPYLWEVYRRVGGATAWNRIAVLPQATTSYLDYHVASFTRYEYAVVVQLDATVTFSPHLELYSLRQSPPPSGAVGFEFIWLHELGTPTQAARLFAHSGRTASDPGVQIVPTWGRNEAVAYTREWFARTFVLDQLPRLRRIPADWARFEALMESQRAGATLVLRLGRDRERYFVAWPGARKDWRQKSYGVSIDLAEVFYQEVDLVIPDGTEGKATL